MYGQIQREKSNPCVFHASQAQSYHHKKKQEKQSQKQSVGISNKGGEECNQWHFLQATVINVKVHTKFTSF